MRLYKTNKTVLSFRNNPVDFLNGLTSNSMEATQNAFLNIHGKIIATFDQLKVSEGEIWAVLESGYVDKVLGHIQKYVMLAKVDVEKLGLNVYFDLDGETTLLQGEKSIPQKRGCLVVSALPKETSVNEDEFTRFRLENSMALHGVDYDDDFILNVSINQFVSYTKGCFLGQEPVSKVYNRSKPTWRLVVKKKSECIEGEAQKLTSLGYGANGEIYGFLFEKNDKS